MAPLKKKDQYDKRQEQVKNNMRRMRERIRGDPQKYEEYKRKERERYHKRKEEGKILQMDDLSDREKRKKRKIWRERSKKYREACKRTRNLLDSNTPPASPLPLEEVNHNQIQLQPTPSRQSEQGKKLSRKHRREMRKKIKTLNEKVKNLERKVEKYKKKASRNRKKNIDPDSPQEKVKQLLKNQKLPVEIKKKVLLGEVITKQIQENLQEKQSLEGKRKVIKAIFGRLMRKYKFLSLPCLQKYRDLESLKI